MILQSVEDSVLTRCVRWAAISWCAFWLGACSSLPSPSGSSRPDHSAEGLEVAMFALGLMDTGYRFGGKNPEAGLDCSGMVSYVFREAANVKVTGSAAHIATVGRVVPSDEIRPGDLVFFNTQNRPYSHVGIYIGDGRFVHAPSSNGKVRVDRLDNRYFASRFEEARTYFD